MSSATLRAVVAGNVALDEVRREGAVERRSCGGTATYASLALRALGLDVSLVGAVGAADSALLTAGLGAAGVDLSALRLEPCASTSFLLEYRAGVRHERLVSRGPVSRAAHVPAPPPGTAFVHLGAVAGELEPDAVDAFAAWGVPLGIDLHALRVFDENGVLSLADAVASGIAFERLDTVKGSLAELLAFAPAAPSLGAAMEAVARRGVRHVLATDGARGAVVLAAGRMLVVPAYPVTEVDATGAGDVFLAGFLAARHALGEELAGAAAFAAAAASCAVEGPATSTLGSRARVLERRRAIVVHAPTAAEREAWTL